MKNILNMRRIWSPESALSYISRVENGHGMTGLTYWSAKDYLCKRGACNG